MNRIVKIIISLSVGFLLFVLSFGLTNITAKNEELSWFVGISIGLIATVFSIKFLGQISLKEKTADGVAKIKSTIEDISSLVDSKDTGFFAIAEKEVNENNIDEGLWALALVKSKGDEKLRKVEYIKLRVKQLKKEKRRVINE